MKSKRIVPRPAFRPFALEDEWFGRRRLRRLAKCMDAPRFARNSLYEISLLYDDAIGSKGARWAICENPAGKEILRERHVRVDPEQAARDLLAIAKNATVYLSLVLQKAPDVCRRIAARRCDWPVMVDLTEEDWRRELEQTIQMLELGAEIKGYVTSARTADKNVIRCWATAIYETLFQTRFDYKDAVEKRNEYMTTAGCPGWVRKTLDLPPFTKADARKWAKLGEEMLLEQRPDFLESPDLAAKKRSWTHRAQKDSRSGKPSLRAIHREAFEDFAKELKNLAPATKLWRGDW